jgi:hypothetical protein
MTQRCPICQESTQENRRYPRYVCRACLTDGIVVGGQLVPVRSVDVYSHPFVECEVRGVRCRAREAHFGGIVVEPVDDGAT